MANRNRVGYDTIVLGSGISGLTAAVLLAKVRGEKVLILEQHNVIGGFTHTFRRGKYEWDTGLHYVGNMGEKDFPRHVMDFITEAQVRWLRMPEVFEIFSFPGFQFRQRAGEKELIEDLCRQFPADRPAIRKYFKDLMRAQVWGTLRFAGQILPGPLALVPRLLSVFWRRHGQQTLGGYFARNIRNADLAAALAGPCGDYGLPPSEASLFVHALIVRHYVNGGYYPAGGSGVLPRAIKVQLQKLGVEIQTRTEATEIVIEKNRVRGVRAKSGGEEKFFSARQVVSSVGARQTFGRLLKNRNKEIENFPGGMGLATIYLGLKESPAKLGFGGENHWLFASNDFEQMRAKQDLPEGEVQGCYISFPSLKDPGAKAHTAEIMVPASLSMFAEVSEGGWRQRGPRYEECKKELARKVLDFVETRFPGFNDLIDFQEVSTPLTVQHFSRHTEVYGLPATPARYARKDLGPRTKIKGLYLAGADVLAHGIVGAMMSGLCAYTASSGLRDIVRLFRAIGKDSTGRRLPSLPAVPAAE